jgi:hypothetical protein
VPARAAEAAEAAEDAEDAVAADSAATTGREVGAGVAEVGGVTAGVARRRAAAATADPMCSERRMKLPQLPRTRVTRVKCVVSDVNCAPVTITTAAPRVRNPVLVPAIDGHR